MRIDDEILGKNSSGEYHSNQSLNKRRNFSYYKIMEDDGLQVVVRTDSNIEESFVFHDLLSSGS